VRVVDEAGHAVGAARVRTWQAERSVLPLALRALAKEATTGYSTKRAATTPLTEALTDADGRCTLPVLPWHVLGEDRTGESRHQRRVPLRLDATRQQRRSSFGCGMPR
jgi:hypothetical protein